MFQPDFSQVERPGRRKDHGFGFVLGVDGGSPRNGWYGGAFTFYTGDVTQELPRATRTNTQWYMLTGYSQWSGKRPMPILRTASDPTRPPHNDSMPPSYLNAVTHWWDASQVYGSDAAKIDQVRSHIDGKLNILPNGLLPLDPIFNHGVFEAEMDEAAQAEHARDADRRGGDVRAGPARGVVAQRAEERVANAPTPVCAQSRPQPQAQVGEVGDERERHE